MASPCALKFESHFGCSRMEGSVEYGAGDTKAIFCNALPDHNPYENCDASRREFYRSHRSQNRIATCGRQGRSETLTQLHQVRLVGNPRFVSPCSSMT